MAQRRRFPFVLFALILTAALAFFVRLRTFPSTQLASRIATAWASRSVTSTPSARTTTMFSFPGRPPTKQPLLEVPGDHFHKATRTLTFESKEKHTATVIFAHGLGDSSDGWIFLKDYLGDKILPNAPHAKVTVNGGMAMNSWFDIYSFGPTGPSLDSYQDDEDGTLKSARTIIELVKLEVEAGIPSDRVVIGGFSQGATITSLAAITSELKLAGQVSLSGRLPLFKTVHNVRPLPSPLHYTLSSCFALLYCANYGINQLATDHARTLQVFWGHGKADPLIKYQWAEMSVSLMREKLKMKNIDFRGYDGVVHTASQEELDDMAEWLEKRIPKIDG
ncbi:alpha/beta-hydrolase, partial [Atractiella rhizophila]